jgi:ribosome-associated toxin RatA of RatAB toxin-antitoxin module
MASAARRMPQLGRQTLRLAPPRMRALTDLSPRVRTRWAPGTHERRHFERRLLPFPPRELYDVVADVDAYSEFVPWCTRSRVLTRIDDTHYAAELAVGFKSLSERYTSLVTAEPHKSVTVDVPNSSLFDYLVNDWTFAQGPTESSTDLSFYVEFRFRNALYQRVTDQFFNAVVKNMVSAFEDRARVKRAQRRPHGHAPDMGRR